MPRGARPKPSTTLVPEEILRKIESYRPLRLFISKEMKKGDTDNPFVIRNKYDHLSREKQARYLRKAVHKYIQLLDENDIDEHIQVECQLFECLLIKSERQRYFELIDAPAKPPGKIMPYYSQDEKEENDDDNNETAPKSFSLAERKRYRKIKNNAKIEYSIQVRNFAENLPERLKTDYLLFAEQPTSKHRVNHTPLVNGHDDNNMNSASIRQRRKSLTALPDSLQTTPTTNDNQQKLNRKQLRELHKCMPNILYYESNVPDDEKPTFTHAWAKNAHIRSIFNQLDEKKKTQFILKSIQKWNEFLASNPIILTNQIPTLHLLLGKNDDICLYFSSLGLPERPPINTYLFYNHEKEETGSQESWSDLSPTEKTSRSQRLEELKNEYYEKFVKFVDHILPSDYMRYEFFRNIKYAIRDYELATKTQNIDKNTEEFKNTQDYIQKMAINNDINQFNQIKQRLLSTALTNEQKYLVEQLNELLNKIIQDKHSNDHHDSNSDKSAMVINSCAVSIAEDTNDEMKSIDDNVILDSPEVSNTTPATSTMLSKRKRKRKRRAKPVSTSASQSVKRKRIKKKK